MNTVASTDTFLGFNEMTYWAFVLFRLSNLLFSATWFVPDEVFQSVEVAYKWVFGFGYLSWEWYPMIALRSAIHPGVYAGVFWALKQLNLDFNRIVYWAPNIVNAFIFAAGDVCYLSFLKRFFRLNKRAVMPAMALYLTNWFVMYCSTRSLSNTIETAIVLIALKWYTFGEVYRTVDVKRRLKYNQAVMNDGNRWADGSPERSFDRAIPFGKSSRIQELKRCYGDINSLRIVVCLASLAVLIRPTAALIFGPLCAMQFWESSKFSYFFKAVVPCGLLVLGLGAYVDMKFYGSTTFPLFNFVRFNVLEGGSAEFGSHVWYWYADKGLPAVLTLLCLPLITYILRIVFHALRRDQNVGCLRATPSRFFWTGVFYIVMHSFIAHKEHRFLLPVIPLLIPTLLAELENYPRIVKKYFKAITIVLNIGIAFYIGFIHQRGPNHAARIVLRHIADTAHNDNTEPIHILQLMPCFSMPQHVRFHEYNELVKIYMLDCTPPSVRIEMTPAEDDAIAEDSDSDLTPSDIFHMDAMRWLRENWDREHLSSTKIIVAYAHTYRRVASFLESRGFVVVNDIFHAHFLNSLGQDERIVVALRN